MYHVNNSFRASIPFPFGDHVKLVCVVCEIEFTRWQLWSFLKEWDCLFIREGSAPRLPVWAGSLPNHNNGLADCHVTSCHAYSSSSDSRIFYEKVGLNIGQTFINCNKIPHTENPLRTAGEKPGACWRL